MNERRDRLSTADLAAQRRTDTAPPDRSAEDDSERTDIARHDPARQGLPADDRPRGAGVLDDRAADLQAGREPRPQDRGRPPDVGVDDVGADQVPAPVPPAESITGPTAGTAPARTTSTAGPLLASKDAEGFRARWTDVQTAFVDAPRQSVEQADALVAELMQHLAKTFADERGRLEKHWDRGDDVSTDDLRTALQRYRSFFERLLAT